MIRPQYAPCVRVTDRDVRRILSAPINVRHWRALVGILRTFDDPGAALVRYVTNRGTYPWHPTLKTPLGAVEVTLADRHDLLTLNEIFCRRDYGSAGHQTVVDIGANVGFASLFFLTRGSRTRVWAFEPDPANIERLRENLSGFEARYTLFEMAVTAVETPTVQFVTAGRYGHVARATEAGVDLPAISIARAVRDIARDSGPIDLVKIDTEGTESELLAAIPSDISIREIRYEDNRGRVVRVRRRSALRA